MLRAAAGVALRPPQVVVFALVTYPIMGPLLNSYKGPAQTADDLTHHDGGNNTEEMANKPNPIAWLEESGRAGQFGGKKIADDDAPAGMSR